MSLLKVGILCEDLRWQRWQADCLRHLQAVPGVSVSLVVTRQATAASPARTARRWSTLLYRRWRDGRGRPGAMTPEDASSLLSDVPRMACRTDRRKGAEWFPADEIERIRGHAPDVLLRFGFNIIRGELLELPTYGVWSFHHGDELKHRGGPPGFWEIMQGDPVTGAVLQRLTERLDGGRILRKGWFKTIDHSLKETVDRVLMHSAIWPAQVCRSLLAGEREAAEGVLSATKAPVRRYPGNLDFLRFRWKMLRNKLRFHRDELRQHEEWNVGVVHRPITAVLEEPVRLNVRWLPAPKTGQFRADPFGYMQDGHLNMLFEKYDRQEAKGTIARLRPMNVDNLKRSRDMLRTDGHLSYPFTLVIDGVAYVVPEQASTGRVQLYRISADNAGMIPVRTLLDEPLMDPTLFRHDGRWWLFGTKAPLTNVELFIYHSERLEGPFLPHPLNPVKSDIRSARPAGTPFVHEGKLWRPAQDSSHTYGGRIAINRVNVLTPFAFREETVKFVGPLNGPWSKGLHTLSAAGEVTLVDGKRWITDRQEREQVRRRKIERVLARSSDAAQGEGKGHS